MIKKKYLPYLISFLFLFVFLIFHNPDKNYLAKKSADDAWNNFSQVLVEIIGTGDYINYNNELSDTEIFNIYGQRISYFVERTNKSNAPKMRRTFVLKTNFKTSKNSNTIEFLIFDEASKQVLESKIVKIQNTNFFSLIPPLLALFLCFFYKKLGLSLIFTIFLTSIVHRKSLFFGISDIFIKYLPAALNNNNFFLSKLIVFLLLINICIYLISKYGGFKALKKIKKTKFFLIPILAVHPYFFSSFGTWILYSSSKYKIFLSQILSLTLSYFFIFNPFNLNLFSNFDYLSKSSKISNIFFELSKYKYFSFSLLCLLIILYHFNKKRFSYSSSKLFSYNRLLKPKLSLLLIPIFSFVFSFYFFSLFIGMLGLEYNGNLIALVLRLKDLSSNFLDLKNYYTNFQKTDIATALLLSALFMLLSVFITLYVKKLFFIKQIVKDTLRPIKLSLRYLFYLLLSSVFILAMDQVGSIHYVISLFNAKIDPLFFPLICFFISLISTFFYGNSLYVILYLPAILAPISENILGINNGLTVISFIIEGAIAGELLCPYSPSSIIISSIYQNNPIDNITRQIKPLILVILFSSLTGFLLINTKLPFWVYYLALSSLLFIFFLNFRNKNDWHV